MTKKIKIRAIKLKFAIEYKGQNSKNWNSQLEKSKFAMMKQNTQL